MAAESYLNRPMGVSIKQHQKAMSKAGRFAITRNPTGMVIGTAVSIIGVFNESANSENKGQTKPQVGDWPTCGGDTSNKPGKIDKAHGLKPKEVKDAIHGVKGNANLSNNPDVEVCNNCGEVFPQTEDGGLGDSIGNIEDEKGN
ncbi:hypothetical protein [Pseudoalteromonas arabiensis]|uniref:hypothetical protein n=1 Tax=Pseudoalteromonas arabiensis TaxID=874454 RepID=UPI000785FD38|nr:hypothetical protein [Pseudoalteromonas arabiensis]